MCLSSLIVAFIAAAITWLSLTLLGSTLLWRYSFRDYLAILLSSQGLGNTALAILVSACGGLLLTRLLWRALRARLPSLTPSTLRHLVITLATGLLAASCALLSLFLSYTLD